MSLCMTVQTTHVFNTCIYTLSEETGIGLAWFVHIYMYSSNSYRDIHA